MRIHRPTSALAAAAITIVLAVVAGAQVRSAHAVLPPGNTVDQWDKIVEDTVVGSGAFQNEGLVYMAYASEAMYRSIAPGRRMGQSPNAAVIEAAYTVLSHYFPSQAANLDNLRDEALGALPDSQAKVVGMRYGDQTAEKLIADRTGDGLVTPIGSTSTFPTLAPGPGVWRLTPAAFAAPQTPWVGQVKPFVLQSADQFLPPPPPSLSSTEWVTAYNEIKAHGSSTNPNTTETGTAKFWTANVIRQYNRLARDVTTTAGSDLVDTARLVAMVNTVGADAQISVMNAKYHYLFWRPVTAIDSTSVKPGGDGFGPTPGYDDGNAATAEQPGWRPLITTPNHPEYPAAHGSITSAEAEIFSRFLGTDAIDVDIHGFDPAGAVNNLDAVRHFATAAELRAEIVNARVWGGVHYRFSVEAGLTLGKQVADYDLAHAFSGNGDK
ncbi:MAG: vanadium-dependent haloperoxidase [Gaiellaceae bacterium]